MVVLSCTSDSLSSLMLLLLLLLLLCKQLILRSAVFVNITYRLSWQRLQLLAGRGRLGVLQLAPQVLDGGERRVDLHGPASFMSLRECRRKS